MPWTKAQAKPIRVFMTAGQVQTQVSNDTGALALPGGWLPGVRRYGAARFGETLKDRATRPAQG